MISHTIFLLFAASAQALASPKVHNVDRAIDEHAPLTLWYNSAHCPQLEERPPLTCIRQSNQTTNLCTTENRLRCLANNNPLPNPYNIPPGPRLTLDMQKRNRETIDKIDFDTYFFDYVDSTLTKRLRWGAIPANGLDFHTPITRFMIVSSLAGHPLTYMDVFEIWGVFREKVEREGYFRWEADVTSTDTGQRLGTARLGKNA